ncbi:hypothetical protein [Hyalangium versicolor]|uniref:hypothetical protein n=1 Tax=Hyalangium versicolor TaxID=2861190 RepID=UPI001CCE3722|nr:hypothetical protein [Hyalangium versicolor]
MNERVAPSQQALSEVLASTTWVCIARIMREKAPEVPIEVRAPEKLVELGRSLELVEEDPQVVCMCSGDVALELHDGAKLLAVLTVHHGTSISWDRWKSHGVLREPRPILDWLASLGVSWLLEEHLEAQQRSVEDSKAEARWIQAMPPCLAPFWDPAYDGRGMDWDSLQEALVAAYPDPEARVRALLSWFGQGEGPWSGFPVYEEIPEVLLLDHSTEVIVSALLRDDLSPAEWEGAARYLSGWEFSKKKPQDRLFLPESLRTRLRQHGMASSHKGNRMRAMHAFAEDVSSC